MDKTIWIRLWKYTQENAFLMSHQLNLKTTDKWCFENPLEWEEMKAETETKFKKM